MEPYEIYLWSMRNGQLLDVLTGHAGPISSLSFSPIEPRLVSGSWDGMVNVWVGVSTVCEEPLDDLEMTLKTRDEHWSCSIVAWSRDIHSSTVRMEPLDDLEMTFPTRDEHWS